MSTFPGGPFTAGGLGRNVTPPSDVSHIEMARIHVEHHRSRSTVWRYIVWALRVVALAIWSLLLRLVWWRGRKISFTREDDSAWCRAVNHYGRAVLHGRVIGRIDNYMLVRFNHVELTSTVFVRNYGLTWCYGWDTKEAMAFFSAKTLEP